MFGEFGRLAVIAMSGVALALEPARTDVATAGASPAGHPAGVNLTPRADGAPMGAAKGAPHANPEVDFTNISFPVLALNGGNHRPIAKTHRIWRERKDFTYVVIPDATTWKRAATRCSATRW